VTETSDFSCPYCRLSIADAAEFIRHTVDHAFEPSRLLVFALAEQMDRKHGVPK
jgi:hypothetical protein